MNASRGALATLVCLWLTLCVSGLYGIASPFVTGHYGYHGGEFSTRARNTLRHGAILPVNVPTFSTPKPETYYLHHPVLTHQLVTLSLVLLGDHEYAVRAPGLLACLACFLLLAHLVWKHWGPWQSALAAATFVFAPINVWFASHIDHFYPSMAALLAFFIFYLRWLHSGRWRDATAALCWAALAGGFEWSPYLAAVPIFLHAIWIGFVRRGRFLTFVPLYALAVALPMAAHALIVWNTGHVAEVLESYGVRTSGGLGEFFYLITWDHEVAMFGRPLLFALGLWLLLVVGRLLSGRAKDRDLVGISFAFSFLLYLHLFRQGALIHAYWSLFGGIACAIAVCDLAEGLAALITRMRQTSAPRVRVVAVTALVAVILAPTLPAAYNAWIVSRAKGGSPFLEPYDPEVSKVTFAELAHDESQPGDVLYIDPSFAYQMETVYYLDRDIQPARLASVLTLTVEQRLAALVLCVPSRLSPEDRRLFATLAQTHPVWLLSGYALLDLRRIDAELHAEAAVATGRRSQLTRYFEGPYAHLRRAPDPIAKQRYIEEFGLRPGG